MGMDGVEIVMAVEDAFAIELSDKEVEKCETPGDLVRLVLSKLNLQESEACQSQRAFFILRRATMKLLALPRTDIRPDARLTDLRTNQQWREAWLKLKSLTGSKSWPPL